MANAVNNQCTQFLAFYEEAKENPQDEDAVSLAIITLTQMIKVSTDKLGEIKSKL